MEPQGQLIDEFQDIRQWTCFGCIIDDEITDRDPIWILAHSVLNYHEIGLMTIHEIAAEIQTFFPLRWPTEDDFKKLVRTLSNNMSISPDFARWGRDPQGGRGHLWCLTGTEQGVPRPDKVAMRQAAKKRKGAVKQRPSRGIGGAQEAVQTHNHSYHPYARAHQAAVPQDVPHSLSVQGADVDLDHLLATLNDPSLNINFSTD